MTRQGRCSTPSALCPRPDARSAAVRHRCDDMEPSGAPLPGGVRHGGRKAGQLCSGHHRALPPSLLCAPAHCCCQSCSQVSYVTLQSSLAYCPDTQVWVGPPERPTGHFRHCQCSAAHCLVHGRQTRYCPWHRSCTCWLALCLHVTPLPAAEQDTRRFGDPQSDPGRAVLHPQEGLQGGRPPGHCHVGRHSRRANPRPLHAH